MNQCRRKTDLERRADYSILGKRASDHIARKKWPMVVGLTLIYIATCSIVLLHYLLSTAVPPP